MFSLADMGSRTGPKSYRVTQLLLIALVVVLTVTIIRTAWVGDDAFISFRVVDNFVHGYGLTWNVIERVQAFTNPLWVLVLSVFYLITGEIYFTSLLLSVVLSVAALVILARKLALSEIAAAAALLVALFSKAFIDYSASGLENALAYFLVAVFCYVLFQKKDSPRQFFWLCLIASLAAVNRLDNILFYIPALVLIGVGHPWKSSLKTAVVGFAPLILWELFSLVYYGFPFPNTYYAKLNTGIPKAELLHQGVMYVLDSISHDPFTLIAIATITVWALYSGSRTVKALALGVIAYFLYTVYVGGDFMAGRFFSVSLFVSAILLAQTLPSLEGVARFGLPATIVIAGLLSPHPTVLTSEDFGTGPEKWIDQRGVADERGYYFQKTGLLKIWRDWQPPAQIVGTGARRVADSVDIAWCVGSYGFTSGAGLYIIDGHALGDPLLARLPALHRTGWRVGHYARYIPIGYEESVMGDKDNFVDKNVSEFYGHLMNITRGNIWSWKRFKTIVKINLGLYDYLLDETSNPVEMTARYSEVSTPVQPGTQWRAMGNKVFREPGIRIFLEEESHVPFVELSSDNNDVYTINFLKADEMLGECEVERKEAIGIRWDTLSVPQKALEEGFDVIQVLPKEGDGLYSIGHVRLITEIDSTSVAAPQDSVTSHSPQ